MNESKCFICENLIDFNNRQDHATINYYTNDRLGGWFFSEINICKGCFQYEVPEYMLKYLLSNFKKL